MRSLNRLGASAMLTLQSGLLVRASGALALLSVEGTGCERQMAAGRALQRLWLAADWLMWLSSAAWEIDLDCAMSRKTFRCAMVTWSKL